MKKFLAILLAALLVLVNVAALAESDAGIPDIDGAVENLEKGATKDGDAAPEYSIKKTYTTTGFATNVYPTETLKFEVTPDEEAYPEITLGTNNTFEVAGGTVNEYTIPVNVPAASEYEKAGRYHYTVKEVTPQSPSQAVTYSDKEFNVDVYVTYDTDKSLTRIALIYSGEDTEGAENASDEAKTDVFNNEYKVGALKVTKEITGNLADPTKIFTIRVTLNSTDKINNDLVIDASTNAAVATDEDDLKLGKNSYEIEFQAIGGQFIQINNIPDGVTYTIEELAVSRITEDTAAAQLTAANDNNAYYVTGEVTDVTLSASATAEDETITNKKNITIPTGIALDTVPYVLIMVLALIGLAVAARKREQY